MGLVFGLGKIILVFLVIYFGSIVVRKILREWKETRKENEENEA